MKPSFALFLSAVTASPVSLSLTPRQSCSPTFTYPYTGRTSPSNFLAFSLPSCTAQLTFTKDHWVGVQWAFEATYADGSRAILEPFRNNDNFGVSDTFYPYQGNNFLTSYPGSSAFTAVHEFTGVCKGGKEPLSWRFYTTSGTSTCNTSPQIKAVGGVSRPAKVSGVALKRSSDASDFTASWSPVAGAAAYSVIVQYPSGIDDLGRPYLSVRGKRVMVSLPSSKVEIQRVNKSQASSATVATTNRSKEVERKVVVHAVNAQGVWSFTSDVRPVTAGW
jgi:hypothetical protein